MAFNPNGVVLTGRLFDGPTPFGLNKRLHRLPGQIPLKIPKGFHLKAQKFSVLTSVFS
jgi:hypothetical protein